MSSFKYDQARDFIPFPIPEGKNIDERVGTEIAEFFQRVINTDAPAGHETLVQFTSILTHGFEKPVQGFRVRQYRDTNQ